VWSLYCGKLIEVKGKIYISVSINGVRSFVVLIICGIKKPKYYHTKKEFYKQS
jgi:hypothetical protein